eukprot:TRINITY_DN1087_c1_g1_i12.p3 TRINITY_DN1087_c1_g1~~TRINITY_DN1087_c1_g1_i12.p3  ORF type:complete len:105 (+),score=24.14 TRINITY_DN1087_c1_g1_i12:1269-1583(+)
MLPGPHPHLLRALAHCRMKGGFVQQVQQLLLLLLLLRWQAAMGIATAFQVRAKPPQDCAGFGAGTLHFAFAGHCDDHQQRLHDHHHHHQQQQQQHWLRHYTASG